MARLKHLPKRLVVLALLFSATVAMAQDTNNGHPILTRKHYVGIGVYFPEREVELRVDGSNPDDGQEIDLSEQFRIGGAEEEGSLELGWRFGEKWLFRGQYFGVDGHSSAVLEEDIVWGDYTFNAGTNAAVGSELQVTRLFVGRQWRNDDNNEFGFGAGVHWLDISAFIQGQAFIDGQDAGFRRESVRTNGPLPNIGAWYVHAWSRRWAMTARLDWLSASVGDYDGSIVNASAGVNYAMNDYFGIGLSYNLFELDIGVKDEFWQGRVSHRFDGAYIYLSALW